MTDIRITIDIPEDIYNDIMTTNDFRFTNIDRGIICAAIRNGVVVSINKEGREDE